MTQLVATSVGMLASSSPKPRENPFPNVWSTYLASDDLDATAAKAKAAGSQFMMEPMEVMTAGRLAFAIDPTGAPYGIWQAGDHKGVGVYNEPGALVWNELMTRDYELSLIHISEPTRQAEISYAVFC